MTFWGGFSSMQTKPRKCCWGFWLKTSSVHRHLYSPCHTSTKVPRQDAILGQGPHRRYLMDATNLCRKTRWCERSKNPEINVHLHTACLETSFVIDPMPASPFPASGDFLLSTLLHLRTKCFFYVYCDIQEWKLNYVSVLRLREDDVPFSSANHVPDILLTIFTKVLKFYA